MLENRTEPYEARRSSGVDSLRLQLLGGMAAVAGNGQAIRFRADKIRALLVYLLLEGGRPHQRQSIAALLWPEMPTASALKNLRLSLHRLQQAFAEQEPDLCTALFTITRQTVQCHRPESLVVDVHTFEALLATSETHHHRRLHLCHDCLERLAQAVALYQGELLAGFGLPDAAAFEEWLLFWRERLQQQVIGALDKLVQAHTERGEIEPAYQYATRLVQLDPFREEAHRQLMRLHASRGDHAKALAQYESCRQLLQEELGVEPAPETVTLYRQIEAEQRGERAIPAVQPAVLYHFPMQFTLFVGRERELQQIEELFLDPDCRLLTLVGPSGVGKTRLSSSIAERLATAGVAPDGIYFIRLASVRTAEALLTALLNGLGVTMAERHEAQQSLFNFLRRRQCLLVLDNFEQLVDHAALLGKMLAVAPSLRLLVTSHTALSLQAERRLVVGGLDYPAADETPPATADAALTYSAVRLFVDAARQAEPAFQLTSENIPAVLEICRIVRGSPLALELAAVWVRMMDCAAIVREIRRNLDFLSYAAQDKPERHQSLAAVFAYSWELLAADEREVMTQLAVFHGPFSLEAAMAITSVTPLILARLLDKSLLQRRQDGRYEFHELLRHFAARQAGDTAGHTAQRHSDYYLGLITAQEAAFYGPQPWQAVTAVRADLTNIRQAWQWAITHRARPAVERSLEAVGRFYETAALLREGERMFAQAIEYLATLPRLLVWHAFFLLKLGYQAEAMRLTQRALAQSGEDELAQAEARSLLGEMLLRTGETTEARVYQQQALASFRTMSDLARLARPLRRMMLTCWQSGHHEEAQRYFQQAVPIHEAIGDKRGLAKLHNLLAGVYYEQNKLALSLAHVQQAQELYDATDDRLDAAVVAANLARLYSHLGQFEQALASNEQAIQISEELGDRSGLARDLSNRGYILALLGDFARSQDFYYQALAIAYALEDEVLVADFQAGIAAVCAAQGDEEAALVHYDLALPTLLAQGIPYHLAGPLLGKAELLYGRGEWAAAQALVGQVRQLAEAAGLVDYLRQVRIWEAKLAFATGNEAGGRHLLAALLGETEDVLEQATLHYELWRMTGDRDTAVTAEASCRLAVERLPSYVNRQRLEQLRGFLGM